MTMQFKPKRAHYTLLLPALALTLAACGDDIQAMTDGSSSGTTTGTTEIDPSTPSTGTASSRQARRSATTEQVLLRIQWRYMTIQADRFVRREL